MLKNLIARLRGVLIAASLCALGACNGAASDPHITQIQQLEDKLAEQNRLRAQRDERLADQAKVIQELRGLGGEKRLDQLVHVSRIAIERLSGGYDDDHDGVPEGVVIYLALYDQEGEAIKAAGSAFLRLFDLSRPEGAQTVGEARWTAEQLKALWYGRFMTQHYTLRTPWTELSRKTVPPTLTAFVQFTDLLSGRVFEDQKPISLDQSASNQDGPATKAASNQP